MTVLSKLLIQKYFWNLSCSADAWRNLCT